MFAWLSRTSETAWSSGESIWAKYWRFCGMEEVLGLPSWMNSETGESR